MNYLHRTIDLTTGLEIDSQYTQEEIADVEERQAITAKRFADEAKALAPILAAKAAAQAKLAALGLTTDDLKALGL